jgi:hypothetical protein
MSKSRFGLAETGFSFYIYFPTKHIYQGYLHALI